MGGTLADGTFHQMKIIWRLFAILVLLSCTWTVAWAQDDGPTLTVEAGFDGYCRENGWCPVRVILANEGADIEGQVQVGISRSGSQAPSQAPSGIYTRPIVLPAQSRKAVFLYLTPRSQPAYLNVYLVSQGQTLASEQVQLRLVEQDARLYGVVSRQPSAFVFLSEVAPLDGDAVVAHLDLETLPPAALAWEELDVVILNNTDTASLDAEQRQALETWVTHGGHLIVGGGTGAAQTAAGVADLLPVRVTGLTTVETLTGLPKELDAVIEPGPYPIAEATLTEGQTLIQHEDYILLARRGIGQGYVDFLAFDAALNPFSNWDDTLGLWTHIVEGPAAGGQTITVHDGYTAHQAASSIPQLQPPSALLLFGFLLSYAILIGPVNYIVLHILDRRDLAWATIPLLILIFTGFAYVAGSRIRGRAPIIHHLAVSYTPEGATTARVTELLGVFSPRRRGYDVEVQEGAIHRLPGGTGAPPLTVRVEEDTSTVDDLAIDVGGLHSFLVEDYVESAPPQADLWLALDNQAIPRLRGTIQNGSIALTNAGLLVGRAWYPLGDLRPGQTIADVTSLGPPDDWTPGGMTTAVPTESSQAEYRRRQFLQTIFPPEEASLSPGAYLMGWSDQAPLTAALQGHTAITTGLSLHIFALTVDPLAAEGTVEIPSHFITQDVESYDSVQIMEHLIEISGGGSLVLRFRIWPQAQLDQVDALTLDLVSSARPRYNLPQLALWNWETRGWDTQNATWGSNAIPEASSYVDANGTLRVRLRAPTSYTVLQELRVHVEGRR